MQQRVIYNVQETLDSSSARDGSRVGKVIARVSRCPSRVEHPSCGLRLNRFSRILNMALMLLGTHYSIGGIFCWARGGSVPLPT
jgi:hypothetical protein